MKGEDRSEGRRVAGDSRGGGGAGRSGVVGGVPCFEDVQAT